MANEVRCYAEGCSATSAIESSVFVALPVGWWAIAEALESKLLGVKRVFTFCPAHKPTMPPIKDPWSRPEGA